MVNITRNTKSYWGLAKLSIIAIAVALVSVRASAQDANGIISGSVVDAEFGGGVSGARISIMGTSLAVSTDIEGRFLIAGVPEGTHTVYAIGKFYKTSTVEDLEVTAGSVSRIDIPLYGDESDIVELDGFTVTAKVLENSDLGLMAKRQRSPSIGDAIGAESLSRLGLGDAADAMSKVTGASVVDGKYVVMRGLSDRYNSTTLNGASVPSSDPNKKAVQLDQFPSGLIDVISTSKTFTPDKSGEFTGGAVDIQTKAFPDEFFLNTSISFGFRSGTTDKQVYSYSGGGDDWMGKDDGTRAFPAIALDPVNLTNNASVEVRDEVIKSFSREMSPTKVRAPLDQSWSIAMGDNVEFLGKRLGYVTSLSYSRDFVHLEDATETRFLTRRSAGEWIIEKVEDFEVDKTTDNVNVGAMFNVSYQLAEKHEVGIKNFLNQSGTDVAAFQQGEVTSSEDIFLRESRLHYTERNVTSHQVYGKHQFDNLGEMKFEWDYSDSSSSQDEPDFRLFFDRVRLDDYPDPEPRDWGFPVGSTNQRLFRNLSEDSKEFGFDVTLPLDFWGNRNATAKFGYRSIEAEREFDEVALGFGRDSRGIGVPYIGDRDTFMDEDFIGIGSDGRLRRVIIDVTDFVPSYDGIREVEAMYAMVDIPFNEKCRFIGGVRKESADISVLSTDRWGNTLDDRTGVINEDSTLPSVNFVWSPTKKQNVRFAYSETVARPNFRELSPVSGFSAIASRLIVGNPNLQQTDIKNLDLRWELFLDSGDMFAVSAFKKDLENPIEETIAFTKEQTWQNVSEGEVAGVEFEFRKALFTNERHSFSFGGNYSLIDSEVTRPDNEIARKIIFDPGVTATRELQGQSDRIMNLDATWEQFKWGSSFTFSYNDTGLRLSQIADAQLPDVYQKPGEDLSFVYSQRFGDTWKLKFKVSNILETDNEDYHTFEGQQYLYSYGDPSRKFSVGLSHSL